ncbi:MAG: KEOPS complex kinase/ATPase Bud32 [Candidatus Pacearchaeota archaeon]
MEFEIIQQGAEAIILLDKKNNLIIKERIKKGYRIEELDKRIRITRTRQERKLLEKASKLINSPIPKEDHNKNSTRIVMPFINGRKLASFLDETEIKESEEICKIIGNSIAKLHDSNIVHGDLTTSNMIIDENKKIWFIDFGLGFVSERIEDKAVDLHLINQAIQSKHYKDPERYFTKILEGYSISKNYKRTLDQLKKVEKRGRYKGRI